LYPLQLLLRAGIYVHIIKEKEQRLVGSESEKMCPSGATCLPADCCFNELAL
jgi:hypothetical protein